jgi:putative membrane protein
MGSADIVPGVSGGTIALILGIYDKLLNAISSISLEVFRKKILFLDFKGALSEIHIRFILPLFFGIGCAIISLARLINYLLHHEPVMLWSFFFGLIAASLFYVGKKIDKWGIAEVCLFVFGVFLSWQIVSIIPVTTPKAYWFIFISGFIAICAMILPGISGAFILLVLGKYEFITGVLKNPFYIENLIIIAVFCFGCLCGLLGFSKILSFLLDRWHNWTMAMLTGLMTGSMKKIWPYKEVIESKIIHGKTYVLSEKNILPVDSFNYEIIISICLIVCGFLMIFLLNYFMETK